LKALLPLELLLSLLVIVLLLWGCLELLAAAL
jgi:hypothetical protein